MSSPRDGAGLGKQAGLRRAEPTAWHPTPCTISRSVIPGRLWESSFFNECFCCENTELSCRNGVSGEEFTAPAGVLFSCVGSTCTHTHVGRVCFYISVWGIQYRHVGVIFLLLLNWRDFNQHSSVGFGCLFYLVLQKCSSLGSLCEADFSRQQLKFQISNVWADSFAVKAGKKGTE